MRAYEKWNYHVRIFDSVEDLIESVAWVPAKNTRNLVPLNEASKLGRTFESWDEVVATARRPWDEGLKTIESLAAELADSDLPKPVCRKRKLRWSEVDGDEVDYDRLRGGGKFWRGTHRAKVLGSAVVSIVIDLNAKISVKHYDILWRGAAALAMTRILEEAGYRVELWSVHRAKEVYSDGSGHFHAVLLKRSSDPLDESTLVNAVSGWFYRTAMFRVKAISESPVSGLGGPREPGVLVEELGIKDPIVISGAYDRYGAISLARYALAKLATPPVPPRVWPEPEVEVMAESKSADAVPLPEPAKPKSAAELRREAAERRRSEREWKRYQKAWKANNREH